MKETCGNCCFSRQLDDPKAINCWCLLHNKTMKKNATEDCFCDESELNNVI